MSQANTKRPGRPRSDASRKAVLDAANTMLGETGFAGLSMEGIAARAGVGKTTIYRWWPTKGAVVIEAFLAAISPRIAFPHSDSAIADITTQMLRLAEAYADATGRVVSELIALGQADPETLEVFVSGYLTPRRAAAKAVLQRGIESGEIHPGLDLEILVDALYAPIFHRMLLKHLPLTEEFVRCLARLVFSGAAPEGQEQHPEIFSPQSNS